MLANIAISCNTTGSHDFLDLDYYRYSLEINKETYNYDKHNVQSSF